MMDQVMLTDIALFAACIIDFSLFTGFLFIALVKFDNRAARLEMRHL